MDFVWRGVQATSRILFPKGAAFVQGGSWAFALALCGRNARLQAHRLFRAVLGPAEGRQQTRAPTASRDEINATGGLGAARPDTRTGTGTKLPLRSGQQQH